MGRVSPIHAEASDSDLIKHRLGTFWTRSIATPGPNFREKDLGLSMVNGMSHWKIHVRGLSRILPISGWNIEIYFRVESQCT
jgi:hypothetical protein